MSITGYKIVLSKNAIQNIKEMKTYNTYLLFYVINETRKSITIIHVLQESMNWQFIIKRWLRENS